MNTNPTPKKSQRPPSDWQQTFLDALADSGHVSDSALIAGVDRSTAYKYYRTDPDFAALWEQAIKASNVVLEDEARRRAVTGVDEPVFQQARQVGSVRKYSDTLLIFLMKGNMPEKYRENISLDARHDVNLNGRVETYVYRIPENGMQAEGDSDGS